MNELYWIMRLDALKTVLFVVCFLSVVICAILCVSEKYEEKKDWKKNIYNFLPIILISFGINLILPNTKSELSLYDNGVIFNYLQKYGNSVTQLSGFNTLSFIKFVLIVITFIIIGWCIATCFKDEDNENGDWREHINKFLPVIFVLVISNVFLPTSADAYIISHENDIKSQVQENKKPIEISKNTIKIPFKGE